MVDPYKWPKMNGYLLVILASYSTSSGKIFGHLHFKPPENNSFTKKWIGGRRFFRFPFGAIWAYFQGLCLLFLGRVSFGFGMLKYMFFGF